MIKRSEDRPTKRSVSQRIPARVSPWPAGKTSFHVSSAVLDPGHDMLGQRIAVLLKHHHVAIAYDPAIAEINEIRLRTVLGEPPDDRFVELARMVDVFGSGHH